MSRVTVTRQIAAPVDQVFARASDFADAARFISAILRVEMLTDGPVGVGTRFRETRRMFGREASEEMQVSVFEPPRRYVLDAQSHGCHYRSELTFTPKDGGTEVAMSFEATPLTTLSKILSFLTLPLMRSAVVKACSQDLDDLKAVLEGPGS